MHRRDSGAFAGRDNRVRVTARWTLGVTIAVAALLLGACKDEPASDRKLILMHLDELEDPSLSAQFTLMHYGLLLVTGHVAGASSLFSFTLNCDSIIIDEPGQEVTATIDGHEASLTPGYGIAHDDSALALLELCSWPLSFEVLLPPSEVQGASGTHTLKLLVGGEVRYAMTAEVMHRFPTATVSPTRLARGELVTITPTPKPDVPYDIDVRFMDAQDRAITNIARDDIVKTVDMDEGTISFPLPSALPLGQVTLIADMNRVYEVPALSCDGDFRCSAYVGFESLVDAWSYAQITVTQ